MISGFFIISLYYLYDWEENERNFLKIQCAQYETIFKRKRTYELAQPNVNSSHHVGLGIWVIFLCFLVLPSVFPIFFW